ncbi:MAG: glycosyltransferase family 39 protein [Patescibacteria group bacterium]|nr:glycosyltransferase family 39 protein [Patescibacteria group bacterium]
MKKKDILILIIVVASAVRLFGLSRGDTVSDEVFMAFRGLGMVDFNEAPVQTTPWEWFDPLAHPEQGGRPWWTDLSMHDHPWGVPLIQHLSMAMFGESTFGFRLPSALLGILSVYVLYRIGTLLYGEEIGLVAAAVMAVTVNSVYISRIGLQEAYVIFMMLLGWLYFIKALRTNPKYLWWVGVIIGLGTEMKYTALIMVPWFVAYLLIARRDLFRSKYLWWGIGSALALVSPSVTYNVMMYRTMGHFDFQFAHIFHQNVDAWQVAPGKDIGSLADRLKEYIPRIIQSNSWLFLLAAAAALAGWFAGAVRKTRETLERHGLLATGLVFVAMLIVLVGPGYRFLTMLTPFLALAAAIFWWRVWQRFSRWRTMLMAAAALFMLFELAYTVNNQIDYYPVGPNPWFSSNIRYENYNWGYNQLDEYLQQEFGDKMPGVTFDVKYQFLENLRDQALADDQVKGLDPYPALIVYEGNFDGGAKLWVLDRWNAYHAWPIIDLQTYYQYLQQNGFDYVQKSGFKELYFIEATDWVPPGDLGVLTQGQETDIKNPEGDVVFKIYKTQV